MLTAYLIPISSTTNLVRFMVAVRKTVEVANFALGNLKLVSISVFSKVRSLETLASLSKKSCSLPLSLSFFFSGHFPVGVCVLFCSCYHCVCVFFSFREIVFMTDKRMYGHQYHLQTLDRIRHGATFLAGSQAVAFIKFLHHWHQSVSYTHLTLPTTPYV